MAFNFKATLGDFEREAKRALLAEQRRLAADIAAAQEAEGGEGSAGGDRETEVGSPLSFPRSFPLAVWFDLTTKKNSCRPSCGLPQAAEMLGNLSFKEGEKIKIAIPGGKARKKTSSGGGGSGMTLLAPPSSSSSSTPGGAPLLRPPGSTPSLAPPIQPPTTTAPATPAKPIASLP